MKREPEIELERVCVETTDDYEDVYYKVFVDGAWLMNLCQTCSGCPEQYKLKSLLDMSQLAYMRLRWSHFRCDFKDCGGETIYDAIIDESGWSGNFHSPEEREKYLKQAIKIVLEKLRGEVDDD